MSTYFTVWGISPAGEALRYTRDGDSWETVPEPSPLQRISVGGASNVVALDNQGNLHAFNGADGWKPLPGSMRDVSVAHDGAMWAINASGNACLYAGETGGWYEVATTVRRIAVGSARQVWALDVKSHPIDLTGGREPFAEVHTSRRAPGSIGVMWDAEDPFDDTKSTHLWIVNQAARLAAADLDPAGLQVFNLIQPGKKKIGDPFHDQLCQGLYDADFLDKYNGPWYHVSQSWAGHFYDPDTQKNWLDDSQNTARKNCEMYGGALSPGWYDLDQYGHPRLVPTAKRGQAGYNLGLALHFLTDTTQPMHAANFCWQNSHPILGYHSRVEEYAMSQQSKVIPPPYTPAPNGALGLTCPRRAADSCACGSACKDLGLYVHAAARNSKDKYFLKLRDVADSDYHGWPGKYPQDYWPHVVDRLLSPMLRDAILVTAQFLVGWMQFAKGLTSFFYHDDNWTNRAGYLTNVSASADGSVWGVNAQQPATADNVYTWNGSGWQGVKGHLTWIAVGSKSEIWGVDSTLASNQNNIRRWNGTKWDTIPGYLTQIAAASDGTVWGVNAQQASNVNNIYRWTGSTWESVKSHLTSIAVGSKSLIWGANAKLPSEKDNVFRFNGANWVEMKGYLTQIAAAPDGTIWGVNGQQFSDANNIYSWNQQSQKWLGVVGYLTQIAPTSVSTFWGVNTEQLRYDIVQPNNIYQYKAPTA